MPAHRQWLPRNDAPEPPIRQQRSKRLIVRALDLHVSGVRPRFVCGQQPLDGRNVPEIREQPSLVAVKTKMPAVPRSSE